ncbi:ABC transporter permease subunit [Paenibacillus sp. HWE-109]|uniref:ABC transporter permease n=1 Tax=Paenibacillus sp. HWE-109 TaxID=1306526 RepID=UPI001EDF6F41|nr:ABC transporter permease subunit [Paenibacillus sp. HWE-109]UKS25698.1 ABC transporter permease subunit [Paenibacillus sp. HWE-109]
MAFVQATKKSKIKASVDDLVKNKWLYIMFLPVMVWYIIFTYWPMFGVVIAFEKYNAVKGIWGSDWVGLRNFRQIFTDPYFSRILKNTFLLNIYGLLFGFPMPIILALCFNEVRNMVFKKITQTLSYLPYFISTVIVCGFALTFLSPSTGVVNLMLNKFGIESIYFLQEPGYFRSIYVFLGIWQGMGFSAIIYIATLSGISPELYEAAKIDGANRWKQLCYITFPSLIPTITIMLILNMGSMLSADVSKIILLYNPTTYETADVLNTYVYRQGLLGSNYSYATAIGLFQGLVAFILVFGANLFSKKVSETSLW